MSQRGLEEGNCAMRCMYVILRLPRVKCRRSTSLWIQFQFPCARMMMRYLDWWACSGSCPDEWDPWDVLVTQKKVIPWLRSIFPKVKPASLCHHSCRHGRATDLFHNCSYAIGGDSHGNKCLTTVGRWRSKAACMCYLHSKINWKD